MRLDKFLKVVGLIKRRTVAKETAEEGTLSLNGRRAKAGAEVKAGDTLEIDMFNYYKRVEILAVPLSNSIPKSDTEKYIKVAEYKTK